MAYPNSTLGIVLNRLNFGEADRIITWLTPEGKLATIAKGVRKQKSKLAGGIELFSESHISYVPGKSDLATLTSARLNQHYQNIAKKLERTEMAYGFLRQMNKHVENNAGSEWYDLLKKALVALNEENLSHNLTELWFNLRWLDLSGHLPNLITDTNNKQLKEQSGYGFDLPKMAFFGKEQGSFTKNHIKLLRLAHRAGSPHKLGQLQNASGLTKQCVLLSKAMLKTHASI